MLSHNSPPTLKERKQLFASELVRPSVRLVLHKLLFVLYSTLILGYEHLLLHEVRDKNKQWAQF